jgi:glutamyl-tRNA synthetase
LRFDDTDQTRSKPQFTDAIAHDLRWLGLEWDTSLHQSERLALYEATANRLKQSGRLYPCFESEDELNAKRERRLKRNQPPIYDRAMLKLTPDQRAAAEANGKRPYWRFLLSDSTVEWLDMVFGARHLRLASLSDPVLIRTDGTPLYSFTSVVDDIDTGISHVIRGEDHMTNTAIQLDIFAALGAAPPRFAHLPLLSDTEGGKLSKRIDSLSLRSLRADGIEAAAIAAYLARLGTSDAVEPLPLADLARSFELGHVARSPAHFDVTQLLALNRRVLHELPFDAVADRLPRGATEIFWLAVRGNLDLLNEARGWWDVVAGTIAPPLLDGEQAFLRAALDCLPPEPWDADVWSRWTQALRRITGRSGAALAEPLRLALTGEEQGPAMHDLLPLIGRVRVVQRLQAAAN